MPPQSPKLPEMLHPAPELSIVRLLSLDVDGVMTDGGMYFSENGIAMLRFHVQDGIGIKAALASGLRVCIISQSNNEIIRARAKALGITDLFLGVENKVDPIMQLCSEIGLGMDEVCHIADDVNDLSLMKVVGVPITVPNGSRPVMQVARFVTRANGGEGAVRELCDCILEAQDLVP